MPVPSERENHQTTQKFHFFENFAFFDHSGRKHTEQTIFNFVIFIDFDSLILEIWKIHRPDPGSRLQDNFTSSLFIFHIWLKKSTPPEIWGKLDEGGPRARTAFFLKQNLIFFRLMSVYEGKIQKPCFCDKPILYSFWQGDPLRGHGRNDFHWFRKKWRKLIIYKNLQYFWSFLAPDFIVYFFKSTFYESCYRQLSFFEKINYIFLEVALSVD